MINSGIKFANSSADIRGLPPDLGEHNHEILIGLLGHSEAEVDRLYEEEVIHIARRPSVATLRTDQATSVRRAL